jgi:hypothetical protein
MSAETLEYHWGSITRPMSTRPTTCSATKGLERRFADRRDPGSPRKVTRSLFNNSAQAGTTASSGSALRRRGAEAGRQAQADDRRRSSAPRSDARRSCRKKRQPFLQAAGHGWCSTATARDHIAPRCRHAGRTRRHDSRCSRSMCGSMLITSTIATSGRVSPKAVLNNIVNWDFVAQNLDGKGEAGRPGEARVSAPTLARPS